MEQIILRLKQEKEDSMNSAYLKGHTFGKDQAQKLHYNDLKTCAEGKIPIEKWIELKELIQERVTDGVWERFTREEMQEFKEGYLDAVQEFWDEVKEQL